METIPISECTKVGYLQKHRGIHGETVFIFEEEYFDSIEGVTVLFIKTDGLLVPFFIEEDGLRIKSGKSAFVKFKWIGTAEKVREYSGCGVYLKKEDIIEQAQTFTTKMFSGFLLFDDSGNKIGLITDVNDYSGNVVLTVDYKGDEVLVPYNESLLKLVDEQLKMLHLKIPEGLLGDEVN